MLNIYAYSIDSHFTLIPFITSSGKTGKPFLEVVIISVSPVFMVKIQPNHHKTFSTVRLQRRISSKGRESEAHKKRKKLYSE